MWYQNIRTALFSFVTIHASDGQTDGRTELRQQYRALHYMQSHGKNYKLQSVDVMAILASNSSSSSLDPKMSAISSPTADLTDQLPLELKLLNNNGIQMH